MKVNNVQNTQIGEIIATSRKGIPNFRAKKITQVEQLAKPLLPQDVIDHFGLDMSTAVKYKGAPTYTPAPESVGTKLLGYFKQLGVDWDTHVDPNKTSRRFE